MRCFDSLNGMIHYYINPPESVALNSLEIVGRDDYLYRLLYNAGYRRIVFLKNTGPNYSVQVRDEFSFYSWDDFEMFEEVTGVEEERTEKYREIIQNCRAKTPLGLRGIPRHGTSAAGAEHAYKYTAGKGWQEVQRWGTSVSLTEGAVMNKIRPVLRSKSIKSVIVMPLEELAKLPDDALNTIKFLAEEHKNTSSQNILVLMLNKREDLIKYLAEQKVWEVLEWPSLISANEEDTKEGMAHRIMRELFKQALAVEIRDIREDEVINLLLYKMLVEKDPRFENLEITKVFQLAEEIIKHFKEYEDEKKEPRFVHLDGGTDASIRVLAERLKADAVIEELVQVSKGLNGRMPVGNSAEASFEVERFTRKFTQRYIISREERRREFDEAMCELNKMTGLTAIKQMLTDMFEAQLIGEKEELAHYLFFGNPGTGKTEVGKQLARLLFATGLLPKNQFLRVTRVDLVSQYVGETAVKTQKCCERALGGVLFVDEVYQLAQKRSDGDGGHDFGAEALNTIMDFMDENKGSICVVFSGYKDRMDEVYEVNPGIRGRFNQTIEFPDYTTEELLEILCSFAQKEGYSIAAADEATCKMAIENARAALGKDFANARTMRNEFWGAMKKACSKRNRQLPKEHPDKRLLTAEDLPEAYRPDGRLKSLEELQKELDDMIGLTAVKAQIRTIQDRTKKEKKKEKRTGKRNEKGVGNYLFTGNPGTGKTEVARLFGKMLCAMGALPSDKFIRLIRKDVIDSKWGESEKKMEKMCERALGGVLFVDEAYQFVETGEMGESPGKNALEVVMDYMEEHKDNICVIFAGYKDKMEVLLQTNEGFHDRFKREIEFPDYSEEELLKILLSMVEKEEMVAMDSFVDAAKVIIHHAVENKRRDFGNARAMRSLLENAIDNQASRIAAIEEEIGEEAVIGLEDELIAEDLDGLMPDEHRLDDPTRYDELPSSVLSMLAPMYPIQTYTMQDLFKAIQTAVLYIKADNSAGSAFLISPQGYAITCYHVIKGTSSIKARMYDPARKGKKTSDHLCRVVNADEAMDLAVIKLEGDSDFPYLPLADTSRAIQQGESFILSGFPFGDSNDAVDKSPKLYDGSISSGLMKDAGGHYYEVQGEAKRGNSGSPLVSLTDGKVIGVLSGSQMLEHEEINHMRSIHAFWGRFVR